jgi:hypothetical protein
MPHSRVPQTPDGAPAAATLEWQPMQNLAHVAVVVRNYDEAIAFYTNVLGFHLLEDTNLGAGKRWVLVVPPGSKATSILLAQAATPEQITRIGNQTGGRYFSSCTLTTSGATTTP